MELIMILEHSVNTSDANLVSGFNIPFTSSTLWVSIYLFSLTLGFPIEILFSHHIDPKPNPRLHQFA